MRLAIGAFVISTLLAQGAIGDPQTTEGNSPKPAPPSLITMPPEPPSTTPVKQEDSPGYVEGYSDGCASANLRYARQEHVKPNKDSKLYESDQDYHAGWDHGYRKCEDKVSPGGLSVPANSVVM